MFLQVPDPQDPHVSTSSSSAQLRDAPGDGDATESDNDVPEEEITAYVKHFVRRGCIPSVTHYSRFVNVFHAISL